VRKKGKQGWQRENNPLIGIDWHGLQNPMNLISFFSLSQLLAELSLYHQQSKNPFQKS